MARCIEKNRKPGEKDQGSFFREVSPAAGKTTSSPATGKYSTRRPDRPSKDSATRVSAERFYRWTAFPRASSDAPVIVLILRDEVFQ